MKRKLLIIGLAIALFIPVFAMGEATLVLSPTCPQGVETCVQSFKDHDQAIASYVEGNELSIDVMINNPDRKNVISARTWFTYNPAHLEAVEIDTKDSLFTLVAPGEDVIEESEGLIKIGRSNIAGGVGTAEAKVATVRFKVITPKAITTSIEFYDYQVSELGHTSLNVIENDFPVNILVKAPKTLKINLNGGGTESTGSGTSMTGLGSNPSGLPVATPIDIGGGQTPLGIAANLIRPDGLQIDTDGTNVILKWKTGQQNAIRGYHVYYGRTSGNYTRHKDAGMVNRIRIENLPIGEVYYFALTAYDANGNESDYSNEVGIIVGQRLSSTAPMEGLDFGALLARVPQNPQNGPLTRWILFSAAGLSAALLFKPKKHTSQQ